jgi:hypothetical protein
MPLFSKSPVKYMARELHICFLYPMLTGNLCLPGMKGYWYLCNKQDASDGSEMSQLTRKIRERDGHEYVFARPEQCYGVDRSARIIKGNRKLHPGSNWITAEWIEAIQNQSVFDPALVYLDTTSFADKRPAVAALKETLRRCKSGTLVIANVMMNNARAGNGDNVFAETALLDNLLLDEHREAFSSWNASSKNPDENVYHSYEYVTSRTIMRSYIFFKGTLPPTEDLEAGFSKFKELCRFSSQTHGK